MVINMNTINDVKFENSIYWRKEVYNSKLFTHKLHSLYKYKYDFGKKILQSLLFQLLFCALDAREVYNNLDSKKRDIVGHSMGIFNRLHLENFKN